MQYVVGALDDFKGKAVTRRRAQSVIYRIQKPNEALNLESRQEIPKDQSLPSRLIALCEGHRTF